MSDKTNVIKISREFKDSILGSIWLGREIQIDDTYPDFVVEAFLKANEELNEAYRRLSGGNEFDGSKSFAFMRDGAGQWKEPRGNHFGYDAPIPTIQVSKTDSKDKAIQSIKKEIESCGEMDTLMTYGKISKTEPELQQAFVDKFNKLSQLK